MSLYDYKIAQELVRHDPPFYALIMAAMAKADTPNTIKLSKAFPETYQEMIARYDAPGGRLDGER